MKSLPKIWDLIDHFKCKCRLRGWWVSDYEDIIHVDGEYHNFLWARRVYPKTFKSVITNHCYSIREGLSYRTINVSYTAWLFPEPPLENIILFIAENPHLLKNTALYDLSEAYRGRDLCLKLNNTGSIVFREFETFLREEYGLNLMDKLPPLPPEHTTILGREITELKI